MRARPFYCTGRPSRRWGIVACRPAGPQRPRRRGAGRSSMPARSCPIGQPPSPGRTTLTPRGRQGSSAKVSYTTTQRSTSSQTWPANGKVKGGQAKTAGPPTIFDLHCAGPLAHRKWKQGVPPGAFRRSTTAAGRRKRRRPGPRHQSSAIAAAGKAGGARAGRSR